MDRTANLETQLRLLIEGEKARLSGRSFPGWVQEMAKAINQGVELHIRLLMKNILDNPMVARKWHHITVLDHYPGWFYCFTETMSHN